MSELPQNTAYQVLREIVRWLRGLRDQCRKEASNPSNDDEVQDAWCTRMETYGFIADEIERGDLAREALTRTRAQAPLSTEQGDGADEGTKRLLAVLDRAGVIDALRELPITEDSVDCPEHFRDYCIPAWLRDYCIAALTPAQNSTGEGCEHQAVAGPCSICGDAG